MPLSSNTKRQMTTAHKPTLYPAIGGEHQGSSRSYVPSQAYSSRDQPGHTRLKFRKIGQGSEEELKGRDLKAELEERERRHFQAKKALTSSENKGDASTEEEMPTKRLKTEKAESSEEKSEGKSLSEEKSKEMSSPPSTSKITETTDTSKPKIKDIATKKRKNPDADDTDSESNDEKSNSDESGSSEDDDDEAELLKELEKIRKQREEEQKRLQKEQQERELEQKTREILSSNPLLAKGEGDFTIKKKWYEDTVFKNQARVEERQSKKRFINDTLRNDFHIKFLKKYVK